MHVWRQRSLHTNGKASASMELAGAMAELGPSLR